MEKKVNNETVFEAEIVGKKQFVLGETVSTRAHHKGPITNGFCDNLIFASDGKTLPNC